MRAPKTRREMLKQLGAGMGTIGLAGLMADKGLLAPAAQASTSPLAPGGRFAAPTWWRRQRNRLWRTTEACPAVLGARRARLRPSKRRASSCVLVSL